MKKSVVCIFAHPDDEAFGPGGTIAKLAKRYNVYLLCATKGQAGKDSTSADARKLASKRAHELRASSKILGTKKVFFLGFEDGKLSNSIYHAITRKVERHVKALKPEMLLTFEPRGVSGHIDHIAMSMITSYVFYRLPFTKILLYYCLPEERARRRSNYFIYFPPGYKKEEIDLEVDTRSVWETKVRAMEQHKSQAHDFKRIMKSADSFPKREYFLVRGKSDAVPKITI